MIISRFECTASGSGWLKITGVLELDIGSCSFGRLLLVIRLVFVPIYSVIESSSPHGCSADE